MLCIFVLLTVVFASVSFGDDRTPFCDTCTCLNQTLINPDVDCSNKIIAYALYKDEMWFNKETNATYNISSVSLQFINLGSLNEKFPKSSLKKLDLSNNGIRNISEDVFGNLEDMEELILSHNLLKDLAPEIFRGLRLEGYDYPLKSLRILRLDNNELHSLDPDLFQHIDREITVLSLAHNPFKVFDSSTIIAITSIVTLEELDISFAQLKTLPQYFLHTPQYLRKLNLAGNDMEEIPETLEDAHVLEELILDFNPISVLSEQKAFPVVKPLKKLHICNMPYLVEIGKHAMSGLESLEELHISDNNAFTTLHDAALVRLDVENVVWPPIKKLCLSNNKLTYLNSTFLVHWDYLLELDLRGNPWTCECENQWMVEELMPIYVGLNVTQAKEIKCAAPVEMEKDTLYDIYQRKSIMRCLDLYGHRPEKDGAILVGILIGILIGIPIVLFILYSYQRNWYGLFDNSPAAYSRQFYRAPSIGEDGRL